LAIGELAAAACPPGAGAPRPVCPSPPRESRRPPAGTGAPAAGGTPATGSPGASGLLGAATSSLQATGWRDELDEMERRREMRARERRIRSRSGVK